MLVLLAPGLIMAIVIAPVLLLTALLLAAAAWMRGSAIPPIAPGQELLLLSALVMGAGLLSGAFMLMRPQVTCFEFDAPSRVLRYEDRWLGLLQRRTEVPFDAISSVRPVLMQPYALDGHFEVQLQQTGSSGDKTLWLGNSLPLAEMRTHAAWLRTVLDDRVQPTLQHDV